jgi:putative oxidoreductase
MSAAQASAELSTLPLLDTIDRKSSETRATMSSQPQRVVSVIRLMVGGVFLSEGIQKFLFTEALGVGRFTKIGIPAPEFLAPFVGVVEIGCGLLVILGLVTRLATVPLLIDILVAIATTKVPMLLKAGFWAAAHEARTDYCMLLGLIFLLVVGGGSWSLDARVGRRTSDRAASR